MREHLRQTRGCVVKATRWREIDEFGEKVCIRVLRDDGRLSAIGYYRV